MSRTALILGLGRFGGGRPAAEFLLRRGYRLRVADGASRKSLEKSCAALERAAASTGDEPDTRIEWRLGAPQEPDLLAGIDLCVVNPAIRPSHPLLAAAHQRGVACTQEANLFLEHFPGDVLLVTGTNGKSTTTTLLERCMVDAGLDALAGGNIGRSLLDSERTWHAGQTAILEISSAQLSRIDPAKHRVAGAVITRITQDHVDWHGSLQEYRAAKCRAIQAADRFVVHAIDDATATDAAAALPPTTSRLRYGSAPAEYGRDDAGWISERATGARFLHMAATLLVGGFHADNLAAAAAAVRALHELPPHQIGLALARVRPLRNRLQLLATLAGRRIFGNAVSTEVQSTATACDAVPGPVHWVGGGKSKDGRYDRVAAALAPRIASAHLFGAAAVPLAEALRAVGARFEPSIHTDLESALNAAVAAASRGESVLFSPAFASFDQFENFRARARAFERWLSATASAAGRPLTEKTGIGQDLKGRNTRSHGEGTA